MGKLEVNKKKKKDALFNTAFDLFTNQNYNFRYCESGWRCQGYLLSIFQRQV